MRRTLRREDRGAAAVEFALIVPLLLILVFGIIAFGLIFSQILALNSAVREGARKAIVNEVSANRTCAGILDQVRNSISAPGVDPASVQVRVTQDGFTSSANACTSGFQSSFATTPNRVPCKGSYVSATSSTGSLVVEAKYLSSIPAAFPPIPRTITLQSKAVFRCEFSA